MHGLEHALSHDQTLAMDDVTLLIHHYLNVCPNQESRTIRTEVCVWGVKSAIQTEIRGKWLWCQCACLVIYSLTGSTAGGAVFAETIANCS